MKIRLGIPGTGYNLELSTHRPGKEIQHQGTNTLKTTGLLRFSPIKLTTRPKWANQDVHLTEWAGRGKTEAELKERREIVSTIQKFNKNTTETSLDLSNLLHTTSLPPIPAKTRMLTVMNCKKLEIAPDVSQCKQMTHLWVAYTNIKQPPDIKECTKMSELHLSGNKSMEESPDLSKCPELKALYMGDCYKVKLPPDLKANKKLQDAHFPGCADMEVGPDFSENIGLLRADISYCNSIGKLPVLSKPAEGQTTNNMREMNIEGTRFVTTKKGQVKMRNHQFFQGNLIQGNRSDPGSPPLTHPQ